MNAYVRTCPWNEERYALAKELHRELLGQGVNAYLVEDVAHDGYDTMQRAYEAQLAAGEGAWHLEDDVVLTSNWRYKVAAELFTYGRVIINGFSRRKADGDRGSHFKAAKLFSYNTCFWVPKQTVADLHAFCEAWRTDPDGGGREANVSGAYDVSIQAYLAARGRRFWQMVPSVVQHREAQSLIGGPGRTTGRQSPTFKP